VLPLLPHLLLTLSPSTFLHLPPTQAYGLYKEDSRDYGSEVIEMLVKFMDNTANQDFIVVLAGYRNLMTKMLNANLNLMSRMGNWIDFPDYDDAELLQISQLLARTYGYEFPADVQAKFTEVRGRRWALGLPACLPLCRTLCLSLSLSPRP